MFLSIGSGVLSSTPPGPINLLIADHVLSGRHFSILALLSGIILADAVYAFLAFWGYYTFFQDSSIGNGVIGLGGGFLVFLGTSSLYKVLKEEKAQVVKTYSVKNKTQEFFKGLMLCGANPTFLVFWVYMASVFSNLGFKELNIVEMILILLGIIIGDSIWFVAYIKLLQLGARKVKTNALKYVRAVIAFILIVLGLVTVSKGFF